MTGDSAPATPQFVSLRVKLLVGFTVLFTVIFGLVFGWYYRFATGTALNQIQTDLISTLPAATAGVDTRAFASLVSEVKPRADGYTYDLRYWDHVRWLDTVHRIEPRATVYTYVAGNQPDEVIFIGDSGALLMPPEGALFLEPLSSHPKMAQALSEGEVVLDLVPYDDKWGSWISAYAPIKDGYGTVVGGLGIDFKADYVRGIQNNIRNNVAAAFAFSYLPLLGLIYVISHKLTVPIESLTGAARRISEGNYEQDLGLPEVRYPDEIAQLTAVFGMMASKVYQREQDLRRQVAELKIEIDENKRTTQVSEIVDSDFFQDLQFRARTMRARKNQAVGGPEAMPGDTGDDAAAQGGKSQ